MSVETFDTPGDATWTAPAGVTSVDIEMWGAAGFSGNGDSSGGGGSGGGGYAKKAGVAVTPGSNYSYHVGAGGNGSHVAENSWWVDSGTQYAAGGDDASFDTGGLGGGGSWTGGTVHTGGSGGAGAASGAGGGGGSGAGSSTNGGNGGNASGLTAGAGGAGPTGGGGGGIGGDVGNDGQSGDSPGGGSGGGGSGLGGGFAGQNGRVQVTSTVAAAGQPAVCRFGGIKHAASNFQRGGNVRGW